MTVESLHPSHEDLFAYRDGELPADRRVLIEAHVSGCHACRELMDRVSGLEATLRQRPDAVEADYYARLAGSVLEKVGQGVPAEEPRVERAPAVGRAPSAELAPRAERPEARPPRERRREREAEEPRRSRAPGFPWAALVSTMAAASAVIVVVVMLFQEGPVKRAVLGSKPKTVAVRDGGTTPEPAAPGTVPPPPTATPKAAPPAAEAPVTAPPAGAGKLAIGKTEAKRDDADGMADERIALQRRAREPGLPAQLEREAPPVVGGAAGEEAGRSAPPAAARVEGSRESAALSKSTIRAKDALTPQAAAPRADASVAAPSPTAYGSIVRRHGLPEVWDEPRVSRDALRRVEPELRYLYMSGAAGTDSARVRLYLAEAARARYEASPDSALFDAVVHHYLRAIRIAIRLHGPGSGVEQIARRRLGTLTR